MVNCKLIELRGREQELQRSDLLGLKALSQTAQSL